MQHLDNIRLNAQRAGVPRWIRRVLCMLFFTLLAPCGYALEQVTVGVLAVRPVSDIQARWAPLADYLTALAPGFSFEVRALNYVDLEQEIRHGKLHFVLTNPAHYILLTQRNSLSSPLATLVAKVEGVPLSRFGGVIFTRADRHDLVALAQIRGQRIAVVNKGSLGGYQAQAMELLLNGVVLPEDASVEETAFPQDRVVEAVMRGAADVGFVRTGVLEGMAREGKLDLAALRILGRKQQAGFPQLLSTSLYPEWTFAARPGINEELARQVAAALLSMPHAGDVAKKLDIEGFTIPTDYDNVAETMRRLRLPPFDAMPEFTLSDIARKYRWPITTALILAGVIVLLVGILLLQNRRIRHASEQWQLLLNALGEGVYGVNSDGLCTFINPSALKLLGFEHADEVLGKNQHMLFHARREDGAAYPESECPIAMTLRDGQTRVVEEWFLHRQGDGFPVMLTTAPMRVQGEQRGAVVVFHDISEQRALEQKLRMQATTDTLTGLANRRLFFERLSIEFQHFRRLGEPVALLMLDIDRFKAINDNYGHAIGDAVLKHFAAHADQWVRRIDLIGRIGGEEFAVVLPGTSSGHAQELADRLRRQIAASPAKTEKGDIFYTVSIGISDFWPEDEDIDQLMARADTALYQAKESGRNASVTYRVQDAAAIKSAGPH